MRPHELLTHSTIVLAVTLGAMGTLACTPPTAAPQEQATPRLHSIGFLSGRSPATRDNEFQQGLSDAGYVIGQSLLIEYRFADGDDELLARQAEELVNLGVEIVVASDTEAGIAAKRATASIPIVIVSSGDPVGAGLVNSLAYPGGNVTGMTSLSVELAAKRLELLKKIAPGISRVGVMADPSNPVRELEWRQAEAAGQTLGVQVEPIYVHVREEVEPAFRRAMASGDDALMVLGDAALASERDTVFELTAEYGIPVMYEGNRRVLDGGLISYGSSLDTRFRRAATYVDRILKGARPADLPVEEPTSFELTINLGAAAAVGVTVPPEVLAQADRVVR